jgi:hypothetical protein
MVFVFGKFSGGMMVKQCRGLRGVGQSIRSLGAAFRILVTSSITNRSLSSYMKLIYFSIFRVVFYKHICIYSIIIYKLFALWHSCTKIGKTLQPNLFLTVTGVSVPIGQDAFSYCHVSLVDDFFSISAHSSDSETLRHNLYVNPVMR